MFLSLHFYQNVPLVQKVEILFFLISLFGLGTWTEYSPSFSKGNLNFLSHNSRMYAILAFLEVSKLIFTFFLVLLMHYNLHLEEMDNRFMHGWVATQSKLHTFHSI